MARAVEEIPMYLSWTLRRILARKLQMTKVKPIRKKNTSSYIIVTVRSFINNLLDWNISSPWLKGYT